LNDEISSKKFRQEALDKKIELSNLDLEDKEAVKIFYEDEENQKLRDEAHIPDYHTHFKEHNIFSLPNYDFPHALIELKDGTDGETL